MLRLRKAIAADVPELQALIARSARGLSTDDYRPAQIEGALRGAFGVDSQLLADETYFMVEEDGHCVGCGGWSYRSTLFGGDARAGRDASVLEKTQPAKIRAFFVDPANARRGIGTLLLEHCEARRARTASRKSNSWPPSPASSCTPRAVMSGCRWCTFDVGGGESIEFVPMRKALTSIPP